jgi:hypothetical protein
MFTAAECRAKALEKIMQAKQDKRHCRKLTSAAEAWLFLAVKLDELEDIFAGEPLQLISMRRPI